jgi:hypothetical protein
MSLVFVIKNLAGLVLAADSALTCAEVDIHGEISYQTVSIKDNKILSFANPQNFTAALTCGKADIDGKLQGEYLIEFEKKLPRKRLKVKEFAAELSAFFMAEWDRSADKTHQLELPWKRMLFYVAGFDKNETYGCLYRFSIPDTADPQELSPGHEAGVFAAIAGLRQKDIKLRFKKEQDRILSMSVREVADLARSWIETIIDEQGADEDVKLGGPVIACTITARDGLDCLNSGL